MDKKRNKLSGTDGGRTTRDSGVKEWKARMRVGGERGCQQMVGTDILYESIFLSCASPPVSKGSVGTSLRQ